RDVAGAVDLFGSAVAAPRSDLAVPRIHGIDRACEAVSRQRVHGLSAGSRRIGARADDRDPARIEQSLELRHRIEQAKGMLRLSPCGRVGQSAALESKA